MKIEVLNYSFLSWDIKVIKTVAQLCIQIRTNVNVYKYMTYLYTKIMLRQ